jgi:hypothetical protein
MKCPNCGRESNGRFCPSCGASLKATECGECGSKLAPGARFCTSCGAEAGAATGATAGRKAGRRKGRGAAVPDGGNLPWYIAGAVLLVLVLVLLVPMLMGGDDNVPAPGAAPFGAATGAAPGTPPPLNGTPREQADRLFNRIMTARESGDTTSARFFAPMGIQAYQAAEPLDDDGLYHLATIHNVAGDHATARQVADRILARSPNHLLGLAAAAEAAEGAGDQQAARDYHRRLVEAYPTEIGKPLPEYQDHARILPEHLEISRRAIQ